jgi:suppressor for copper-sensitivity B
MHAIETGSAVFLRSRLAYKNAERCWRYRMRQLRPILGWLCGGVMFAGLAGGALAASGDWSQNDHVEMRLISAVEAVGDRETLPFGLQFRMKPGWKLYWRTPGDAGFPPRPIWQGSENIADVTVKWPAPKRFSILGLETLGYVDEVILPLTAKLERRGEGVTLKASVDYLTCNEICIPYTAVVDLPLGTGVAAPSLLAHDLDRYRARVPGDGARHGVEITAVQLAVMGKHVTVNLVATALEPFLALDVYVEGPEGSFFGKPEIEFSNDGRTARIAVKGGGFEKPVTDAGAPLTLTLVDGARMLETFALGRPGGTLGPTQPDGDTTSIWPILLFALIGGFILNLMPCVLPVLSLKLLSVVSHGGQDPAIVRRGFIASAAGIILSFLLIATVLIGLQSGGVAIGWGIQFQQPVFLVAMLLVVTLFACNLFGFFEIILPSAISDLAGTTGDGHSLGGHFLTGAFAALLATPCSAPFLGTAVGFALSRGPVEILIIFLVLGLGLALPYLLVAAMPGLATRLPRPGNWMMWLRYIFGFALVATAVWLVTVLWAQLGQDSALAIAGLTTLLMAVLAIRRMPDSRLGNHAGKVSVALAAATLVAGGLTPKPDSTVVLADPSGVWQPFDEAELARLASAGKTVIVDVTADWCLTCQINKKLVLDTPPVADWLQAAEIVAMRADWTRPNLKIAAYLANFGRYGIPFNAIYGPQAPKGIALPELLTSELVIEAALKADLNTTLVRR